MLNLKHYLAYKGRPITLRRQVKKKSTGRGS